jgi:uncharacterized protein YcfJ
MHRWKTALSLLIMTPVLAISACAVAPPSGPDVVALPGPGQTFSKFQQDDNNCRNYAQSRTIEAPQQAANAGASSDATAIAGTLIGAAAGAALGSLSGNVGAGAAIGAGAGLLGGASEAGDQAQGAADSLQAQYDAAYSQCMVGNGETLQGPPAAPPVGYFVQPQAEYAPPPVVYEDVEPPVVYEPGPTVIYENGGRFDRYDERYWNRYQGYRQDYRTNDDQNRGYAHQMMAPSTHGFEPRPSSPSTMSVQHPAMAMPHAGGFHPQ